MDDLIAWYREQLDAREREILEGWDSDGKARVATMWVGDEPGYTTVASDHADDFWVADGHEVTDGRHVRVLWDPAAELADIAARRQVLGIRDELGPLSPEKSALDWVVATMATGLAHRPGYREEWRP